MHCRRIGVASPEPISIEVENESWARPVTFRPERAFVLATSLTEAGKSRGDSGRTIDLGQRTCRATTHPRHGVHLFGQIGDLGSDWSAHLPALRSGTVRQERLGDKTVGRGCLPKIIVKDGEFPKRLQIYGRTLEIAAPVNGKVSVSMTSLTEDLSVEL